MREAVLYYTPETSPRTAKIKGVLVRMGVRIRNIAADQAGQQVGYLAGLDGFEAQPEDPALPQIPEEMLVMHQFTGKRIDELLLNLRKAGVSKIALKAVVTESNQNWTFYQLYQELKEEHEKMSMHE